MSTDREQLYASHTFESTAYAAGGCLRGLLMTHCVWCHAALSCRLFIRLVPSSTHLLPLNSHLLTHTDAYPPRQLFPEATFSPAFSRTGPTTHSERQSGNSFTSATRQAKEKDSTTNVNPPFYGGPAAAGIRAHEKAAARESEERAKAASSSLTIQPWLAAGVVEEVRHKTKNTHGTQATHTDCAHSHTY